MTPEELQELRDWSARKMGWRQMPYKDFLSLHYQFPHDQVYADCPVYVGENDKLAMAGSVTWQPDNPATGQIWIFVERMRELGWQAQIWIFKNDCRVVFYKGFKEWRELRERDYTIHKDPCIAILLAGKATEG